MTARSDTIAAIATPPGQGGVAIVRVSGPDAVAIVGRLVEGATLAEPRRVYVGRLSADATGSALDEVVVFRMAAPASYTGEDVVEVQCHGGSLISRRVLERLLASGARAAEPGEFTKRAFLNGRIDLAQAEAVADLIAARTEAGLRLAWSQLDGQLSRRVDTLRSALVAARASCEAAIDFPDEDIPELTDGRIAAEVRRVQGEIERLMASFDRARVRFEGARVAVVGKPNVGKSSLLNLLAGHERAIVTPIAGTTRDVIEAALSIAGCPVVLSDTAGIRRTEDSVERVGVERSHAAIADAAALIVMFDRSQPLDADDVMVARASSGRAGVAVLNKSDLPRRIAARDVATLMPRFPVVELSTVTSAGVDELTRTLGGLLFAGDEPEPELSIYRARHRDAARRAVEDLARAGNAIARRAPPELIASDLARAAAALAVITGEVTSEDVLNRVFAEFCIGK